MTIQPSSATTTTPVFQTVNPLDLAALHQQATSMITGFWVSQLIQTASRLSLFNLLHHGPRRADDLATTTGMQSDAIRRLLRALASIEVVTTPDRETFALSPLGALFMTGLSGTLGDFAIMQCDPWCWRSWGELPITMRTGQATFQRDGFPHVFAFMGEDPDQTTHFNRAMVSFGHALQTAIIDAYDFSPFSTLVDVGGGHGAFVSMLLAHYPDMRAQILDLPHVVIGTNQRLRAMGLNDRCVAVPGDFFVAVPAGADIYTLSFILHDWDDTDCLTILRSLADAARFGTTLLISEMVLPDDPRDNPAAYLMDMNMLAAAGGRERTAAEYTALLHAAGFTCIRQIATGTPITLIEAMRQ